MQCLRPIVLKLNSTVYKIPFLPMGMVGRVVKKNVKSVLFDLPQWEIQPARDACTLVCVSRAALTDMWSAHVVASQACVVVDSVVWRIFFISTFIVYIVIVSFFYVITGRLLMKNRKCLSWSSDCGCFGGVGGATRGSGYSLRGGLDRVTNGPRVQWLCCLFGLVG